MADDAIVIVIKLLHTHNCTTVLEYGTNVGYLANKLGEFKVTSIERDDRFYAEAKKIVQTPRCTMAALKM